MDQSISLYMLLSNVYCGITCSTFYGQSGMWSISFLWNFYCKSVYRNFSDYFGNFEIVYSIVLKCYYLIIQIMGILDIEIDKLQREIDKNVSNGLRLFWGTGMFWFCREFCNWMFFVGKMLLNYLKSYVTLKL